MGTAWWVAAAAAVAVRQLSGADWTAAGRTVKACPAGAGAVQALTKQVVLSRSDRSADKRAGAVVKARLAGYAACVEATIGADVTINYTCRRGPAR